MRSWHTAPAAAAAAILALSACTGPTSPAVTAPRPASPAAPASSGAAAGAADWPTYHETMSRAGVSGTMPAASRRPKRIQSLKLDGEVFASPIVAGGLTIVATEQDTVYAFDQSYRQVWKRSLGSPSPAEERQCGDINPLGITGTPATTPRRTTSSWWPNTAERCGTNCMPWMSHPAGWRGARTSTFPV
jgi:hypothetical protein